MNRSIVWLRKEKAIDIGLKPVEGQHFWNPSIVKHNGEMFVSYRGYVKDEISFRAYRSPLIVGILKDDKLTEYKEIQPKNVPDYVKECGIEDVRLWSDGKDIYGIGVLLSSFSNGRLNVRLGEIKIDYKAGTYDLIQDFGQPYKIPEKNWSPIEGKLHEYMYSVDRRYKESKIHFTTSHKTVDHRLIHNGTNLVKVEDGYIAVVHQRTRLANGKGCYPNMFVKYNQDLVPTHNTDWFVFKDYMIEEVQFMAGAAMLDSDTIGITVGLDRITSRRSALYKSLLYKVNINDIEWQKYNINPLIRGYYKEGNK